jgi:coenzyme F420 hydrogenase subunit beta
VTPDHQDPNNDCLRVCPVVESDFTFSNNPASQNGITREWGPILEIWEGHAADPEIRFQGSSGGALTAISAFCIERMGMGGVLHIGQDDVNPLANRTYLSKSRAELLSRAGSRYAPASVCDRLDWIEQAASPCVVIGRPVEIAALRNAEQMRPALASRLGLALSFFCAESPSTAGTLALTRKLGVVPEEVSELRYRGRGWPGHFSLTRHGEDKACQSLTYRESWGFLQAFRPWSAHMWPDGMGELADISCGDPWYEKPDGTNPGFSLVVVRTERGRKILRAAMDAGYLALKPAEHWKLVKSQSGLLQKKGSVWGRRLALRLMGLPVTRFKGLSLFHCWRRLAFRDKLKSVFGTLRRCIQRRHFRALDLRATETHKP